MSGEFSKDHGRGHTMLVMYLYLSSGIPDGAMHVDETEFHISHRFSHLSNVAVHYTCACVTVLGYYYNRLVFC